MWALEVLGYLPVVVDRLPSPPLLAEEGPFYERVWVLAGLLWEGWTAGVLGDL